MSPSPTARGEKNAIYNTRPSRSRRKQGRASERLPCGMEKRSEGESRERRAKREHSRDMITIIGALTLCPDSSSRCRFECGPSPLNAILDCTSRPIRRLNRSTRCDESDDDGQQRRHEGCCVYLRLLYTVSTIPCALERGEGGRGETNNRYRTHDARRDKTITQERLKGNWNP